MCLERLSQELPLLDAESKAHEKRRFTAACCLVEQVVCDLRFVDAQRVNERQLHSWVTPLVCNALSPHRCTPSGLPNDGYRGFAAVKILTICVYPRDCASING